MSCSTLWVFLLYSLAAIAEGYSTFDTACSPPSNSVHFVGGPSVRGTLDIIWTCLFTILACTWTIQHLNVPEQKDGRDPGILGNVKWMLKNFWNNMKWMLIAIIAPELLLGKAFGDLLEASESCRKVRDYASADGVEWSLAHAFFADMGGFVLRGSSQAPTSLEGRDSSDLESARSSIMGSAIAREDTVQLKELRTQPLKPNILRRTRSWPQCGQTTEFTFSMTPTSCHEDVIPGREALHSNTETVAFVGLRGSTSMSTTKKTENGPSNSINTSHVERSIYSYASRDVDEQCRLYSLISSDIHRLRQSGILPRLPSITTDEINDRSKGDVFTKLLVVVQVLWIITEVISRAVKGLSISQLELVVVAIAACSVVTYGLLLFKPKGVLTTITLLQYDGPIPKDTIAQTVNKLHNIRWVIRDVGTSEPVCHRMPIGNFYVTKSEESSWGALVGAVLFGAVHCAGWNFSFPTETERDLWRTTSVFITSLPVIWRAIDFVGNIYKYPADIDPFGFELYRWFSIGCTGFYALARIPLMVITLRSLFYMPPDVYIATWASNIPHVS